MSKKYKKIPIFIADMHNDVLPFIYRAIGSKHLPLFSNTIVHFDSHPDLGIPYDLTSETVLNKYELFENLNIENWILPACYAGHISNIVWIKPKWANQIADQQTKFVIGKHKLTNKIRVTCPEKYFVGEGLFTLEKHLENTKDVSLNVSTIGNDLSIFDQYDQYILDIDLDFFSTKNPFRDLYSKANIFKKLRKLYGFTLPENLSINQMHEFTKLRKFKLNVFKSAFKYVSKFNNLDDWIEPKFIDKMMYSNPTDTSPDDDSETENEIQYPTLNSKESLQDIVDDLKNSYTEIDWDIIHDFGCTFDDDELPHYVSSKDEILSMMHEFKNVLDQFPSPPTIITIARSSLDDYCPKEDVDFIQTEVLNVLNSKYCTGVPDLYYLEDD